MMVCSWIGCRILTLVPINSPPVSRWALVLVASILEETAEGGHRRGAKGGSLSRAEAVISLLPYPKSFPFLPPGLGLGWVTADPLTGGLARPFSRRLVLPRPSSRRVSCLGFPPRFCLVLRPFSSSCPPLLACCSLLLRSCCVCLPACLLLVLPDQGAWHWHLPTYWHGHVTCLLPSPHYYHLPLLLIT